MKKYLLVIVTILLFAACKNNEKKPLSKVLDDASKAPSMQVAGKSFRVDVPEGWTAQDTLIRNIAFYFLYPPAADRLDNASINIIHEGMQGLSLSAYKQATLNYMKQNMSGFEIKEEGEIEAGNLKGFRVRYSLLANGSTSELIDYTIPSNGVAYIITASTAANKMDKYKKTFDAVTASFRVQE